jgi:hypothetical protein
MRRWVVVSACLLASTPTVSAQNATGERNRLIVSGSVDQFTDYAVGGSAGISWLRVSPSNGLVELGAYTHRVGATHWHFGRFGWSTSRGRTSLTGSLDLGGGRELDEGFAYLFTRAGAGIALWPGKVYLHADAEYVDVHRTRGFMVNGSSSWLVKPWLAVTAEYRHGLSERLRVGQLLVRTDVYTRSFHLLGGCSTGTFLARELPIVSLDGSPQTEWFAGVGFPAADATWTLVYGGLISETVTRHSINLSLQMGLGGR